MSAEERSAIDEAWVAWTGGKVEDAIRRAAALLEKDPSQLGAAALLFEVLLEQKRTKLAAPASDRLVEASIRRGDLARAIAITVIAARANVDAGPLRARIAKAFALGSAQVADVSLAPPPFPPAQEPIPSRLAELSGDALLDAGEKVLDALLKTKDPRPAGSPVPRLPFFGALAPEPLEHLLSAWEIRELAPNERAVEEGAEGREAFIVVRGRLRAERKQEAEPTVLAILGPGALFGEMALVSDAPRAASVIAEEPVQLIAASRASLEKLSERSPAIGKELSEFCRARMISNLLRHSPLLRAVEPAKRESLITGFETKAFKAGELLVTLGQEPPGLFLIASGAVRVMGRDRDGEELQVAELGPGDVVGEISLVLRRPATADVRATHLTIVLHLKSDRFKEVIKEHPTLLGELYELATKREEEMRSVVAQEALDVEEVVLL